MNFMKAAQDMIHDYEERATALNAWIGESDARFAAGPQTAEDDFQGTRNAMMEFKDYRRKEKSGRVAEQNDLAALLSNIQTKLKSLKKPAYQPPAGLSTAELEAAMEQLTSHEQAYRATLSARLRAIREKLRHDFADVANPFATLLASYQELLGNDQEGDFAEQKTFYEGKRAELADQGATLEAIRVAEEACEACMIEENEYSDHTYEDLQSWHQQLLRTMDKKIAFLNSQINEATGDESASKRAEFEQSFDFFDKDHNGILERLDFFACLASLGLAQVDFSGSNNKEAEEIFNKVSEGTGKVTKDQYVRFMQEMTEDTFDPAKIAEAIREVADGKDFVTETDLQRAGLDAELIEYIKPSKTPVIIISAMNQTGDKIRGLKMGADDYIGKPFQIGELLARVEALLRRTSKKEKQ